MRPQLLDGDLGMEIAVDDLDLRFLRPVRRPELHVHGGSPLTEIYADWGDSDRG
jgi:hypothetical protein